jgi:formamidopyrimidine-DNA glycosylase
VPELPEVETIVRELRPRLVRRRIAWVERDALALRRPWARAWEKVLPGRRVQDIRRRGKWIVVTLEEDLHLVFHLGMTGQLLVTAANQPRPPHTHLVLALQGGGKELRFRDVRRFGSVTLFDSRSNVDDFFQAAGLGPEPFDLDPEYWRAQLANTRRSIKAVLLDQRVVAGVGNIYADESLFAARLPPTRLGQALKPAEAERLRRAVPAVMERAIDKRGSSIRDYIGGSGRQGDFQEEFSVYGRTGRPCLRCRALINRIRLAGRATHFCPRCQK